MWEYNEDVARMEDLARALMTVAFPGAPEIMVGTAMGSQPLQAASAVDNIKEIKKYKSLLDEGVISKEEFELKKKQILGI